MSHLLFILQYPQLHLLHLPWIDDAFCVHHDAFFHVFLFDSNRPSYDDDDAFHVTLRTNHCFLLLRLRLPPLLVHLNRFLRHLKDTDLDHRTNYSFFPLQKITFVIIWYFSIGVLFLDWSSRRCAFFSFLSRRCRRFLIGFVAFASRSTFHISS